MATVLVVNVYKKERPKIYIEDIETLEEFYDHLDCSFFDVTHRKIGGKMFDIFVDDCGLMRNPMKVSVFSEDLLPELVGNCIFANSDDEGNTTSLTQEDIDLIMNNVLVLHNPITGEKSYAIRCA